MSLTATPETLLRTVLLAHAPLALLVGQRVAQNAIGAESPTPYIVYASEHQPTLGLSGDVLADDVTLTLQCWGASAVEADAVADAATEALRVTTDPLAQCQAVIGRVASYDAEVSLDATTLTVQWLV